MIRSPLHRDAHDHSTEQFYQTILKTRFPETTHLDFNAFPLDDSEFSDRSHLNLRGSDKLSTWFNGLLIGSTAAAKLRQDDIDKSISALKPDAE